MDPNISLLLQTVTLLLGSAIGGGVLRLFTQMDRIFERMRLMELDIATIKAHARTSRSGDMFSREEEE